MLDCSPTLKMMPLVDGFGRQMTYLRIGVTDRCNLRCRYCMPASGIDFVARKDLLNYDEILRLSSIFKELGVDKVRITGGEPFVRKDMDFLVHRLLQRFERVHITTNATRVHNHMELLAHEHIGGINISLDSLDPENFYQITRRDEFQQVITNVHQCIQTGIPVKLNMVVMKGMNEGEIPDFLRFGSEYGVPIRFIEAMPFNASDGNHGLFMSYKEILDAVKKEEPDLEVLQESEPSAAIQYQTAKGNRVEIIPAYSRSLCGSCNRIRITPKGRLLTCLYAKEGLDLRSLMRDEGLDDVGLAEVIQQAVALKKKDGRAEEAQRNEDVFQSMTSIGG